MGKNAAILLPIAGAGVALLWYGMTRGVPTVKAVQTLGAAPVEPGLIPKQTTADDPAQATYKQLLAAYMAELHAATKERDKAKATMADIEGQAETACSDFAQNETWSYQYGVLGMGGWTQLLISKSSALRNSCRDYVKGVVRSPGSPSIKAPPRAGANSFDQSWLGVAQKIRALQQKVKSARDLLPGLRLAYRDAKKKASQAEAKIADLQKKIADLHAREVY